MASVELLQGLGSVTANGTSVILTPDYLLFTGYIWPTSVEQYIPITDPSHTFVYDIIYESDAGNYFYWGIERFNSDKTTGSNNATLYQIATNNTAKSKQRVQGTVNIAAAYSGITTTAYIRLRILNNWTNSSASNVTAKIYHMSLREVLNNDQDISVLKTGEITADQFWEGQQAKTSFDKYGAVLGNHFYEY